MAGKNVDSVTNSIQPAPPPPPSTGWDGPVLMPAKLAIAARRVERWTSVPYMRQG